MRSTARTSTAWPEFAEAEGARRSFVPWKERVGLKEVLTALDEFAKDQHEYGRRLSELDATVRSVDGRPQIAPGAQQRHVSPSGTVGSGDAEIKELVIRVFNL